MTKNKKLLLIAGVICLVLCLCLAACGSGGRQQETEPAPTGNRTYTIQVRSEAGMPVPGVGIYIYTDDTKSELVWFDKTNDNGEITFTDAVSDSMVAVLSNVPEEFVTEPSYLISGESTVITLPVAVIDENELANMSFKLGDAMMDFTVTDTEGKEYTISQLLKEKEAVVLNFWYIACGPCNTEFPYLQEAYEEYSDLIEVVAMNPVDGNEEIAAFKEKNGYSFIMAACDPAWATAMHLTGYPTTVVINRSGTISLIHTGAITTTENFEGIFAHFTSPEYDGGVVEDIEDIETVEEETGTAENPMELSGVSSFEVTVKAGELAYVNIYKVTKLYLQVRDADAYIIYNEKTYKPTNGAVGLTITSDAPSTPVKLAFGNSGEETKTFKVTLGLPQGSFNNPYAMDMGDFQVQVNAGNNQGVYYQYTAKETGVVTISCVTATSGIDYDFSLYNLNTYAYRNLKSDYQEDDEGFPCVTIKVNKGNQLKVCVSTLPDESGVYPAGKFTFRASFTSGAEEEEEKDERILYAVTVTDENRTPLENVQVYINAGTETINIKTDANGIAQTKLDPGSYTATIKVPAGYTAKTTQVPLSETYPTVSLKLDTIVIEMADYAVQVLNEAGKAVKGALVSLGDKSGYTDENGKITFNMEKDSYTVSVSAEGYRFAAAEYPDGAESITITLKEGLTDGIDYVVYVTDFAEEPVSDVTVSFIKDGEVAGVVNSDEEGKATICLVAGEYTFSLGGYYYDASAAVLTEEVPEATIMAAAKLSGEFEEKYFGDLYYVEAGATYAEIQSDVVNYFLFVPTESGLYEITTTDPEAQVSNWGSNLFFAMDHTTDAEREKNSYLINVKDENVEQEMAYIIGVTGTSECILQISRVSDYEKTFDEYPWSTDWQTGETPAKVIKVTGSGKLTTFDISKEYKLVLGDDGFYHLDSPTGQIVYVQMAYAALSFQEKLNTSAFRNYYFDEEGDFQRKEDYTDYMTACVNNMDTKNRVYPLTADLMYILKEYGTSQEWYVADSVVMGSTAFIEESAWLVFCCYFA